MVSVPGSELAAEIDRPRLMAADPLADYGLEPEFEREIEDQDGLDGADEVAAEDTIAVAVSGAIARLSQAALDPSEVMALAIPDPEDDSIAPHEFNEQIEAAWQICDRFDLQTDIWRGQILRAVRDREKKRGEGRGAGFLNWLKDRELSKSHAYNLIELADSADKLLASADLSGQDLQRFSKRAFIETAKAPTEVQQIIASSAQAGERVTRQAVRQLSDEWEAMTSELLPESVRTKAADHSLPARYLGPLVRDLGKLPEAHQAAVYEDLEAAPDVDGVKEAAAQARSLARYLDAAGRVAAFERPDLDLELALEEALRLGVLNIAADLVNQATQLEQSIVKTYTTWKRLRDAADRLWVESGASTPHLRQALAHLTHLTGDRVEMPLAGGGDRMIRLQFLEDGADASHDRPPAP